MPPLLFLLVLVSLPLSSPLLAQRLLWERAGLRSTATGEEHTSLVVNGTQLFVAGGTTQTRPSGATCYPAWRGVLQVCDLNGSLLHEELGRGANYGLTDLTPAMPGGRVRYWWTGNQTLCPVSGNLVHGVLLPVKANGDTTTGWGFTPPGANSIPRVVLAHGRRVVVAGIASPTSSGANGQLVQNTLVCLDTTGRLLWQYAYPRLPLANDYLTALARLPNGGYLLAGDGQVSGSGFQHLFTETDSLGTLRRQRLIYPLGPAFTSGDRTQEYNNLLVLPNDGGYLASGTADSTTASAGTRHVGYVMKLDTALNLVWTCRLPTAWDGNNVRSQYAYKVRPLPNGTFAVLLSDAGPFTADTHLVQLSAQGIVLHHYTLSSNAYNHVKPLDWAWLGDSTLVLAGTALINAGPTLLHSYLARWDLRGTALLAARNQAEAVDAAFTCSPNPSPGPLTLRWQLPPGTRAGKVGFYSALGQLVRTLPLPPTAEGQQEVSGLPLGLYLARLTDTAGRSLAPALRVLVQE